MEADAVSTGFRSRVLYEDPDKGEMTCLLKWEPGASLPFHRHPELEQSYVIEGSFYDHDGIARAGEYVWRLPEILSRDAHGRGLRDPRRLPQAERVPLEHGLRRQLRLNRPARGLVRPCCPDPRSRLPLRCPSSGSSVSSTHAGPFGRPEQYLPDRHRARVGVHPDLHVAVNSSTMSGSIPFGDERTGFRVDGNIVVASASAPGPTPLEMTGISETGQELSGGYLAEPCQIGHLGRGRLAPARGSSRE